MNSQQLYYLHIRQKLWGRRCGRLIITNLWETRDRKTYHYCSCSCGNYAWVRKDKLLNGATISCGCARKERNHGFAKASVEGTEGRSIYLRWRSMMSRCYNPNTAKFYAYGARGISVCERWHDFRLFYEDMGDPPEGLTLERVDNNGDYCPANVIWADNLTQRHNRRAHGEARRDYEEIVSPTSPNNSQSLDNTSCL
jgi:hypothetical protein